MDVAGRQSREADKVSQMIARTRAYGNQARIYMECTVSTEASRTWQEYINGSPSHIVMPCPHCNAWVGPEREHLLGWHEKSASQVEARDTGRFSALRVPRAGRTKNESPPTDPANWFIMVSQSPKALRQKPTRWVFGGLR